MSSPPKYRFAWDEGKALINRRKHGITFRAAAVAFHDPLSVTLRSRNHDSSEERWTTVGLMDNGVLIVVAHAIHETEAADPTVRIISVRKASVRERREYESGQYSIREPAMTDEYMTAEEFEMKDEYDFSKGERGKYKDAIFFIPVWLDLEVVSYFSARAEARCVEAEELLTEILRSHIEPAAAKAENSMKEEYDFSKGERGKFYRENAVLRTPTYLDADVLAHFAARAESEGVTTGALLSDILRRQMEPAAEAERR